MEYIRIEKFLFQEERHHTLYWVKNTFFQILLIQYLFKQSLFQNGIHSILFL